MLDAARVDHRRHWLLALGAQVEMILEQLAGELAAISVEAALEVLVGEPGGLGAF
ncbi:MAG: hypothetical protein ACRDOE_20820 [Streptosporangiaceae bacterium]